jgi:hypothetical protein
MELLYFSETYDGVYKWWISLKAGNGENVLQFFETDDKIPYEEQKHLETNYILLKFILAEKMVKKTNHQVVKN